MDALRADNAWHMSIPASDPMKKLLIHTVLAGLAAMPALCHAWGADGHQSVGAIADKLIEGTPAGAKVKTLLGDGSLEKVSVWADCAKGIAPEKDFAYGATGRYPECAPFETPAGIAALADYVRRNNTQCNPGADEETCHKQYHYADVSLQHEHYQAGLAGTSKHDIVHAIRAAIQVLQGKPSPAPFHFKDPREALIVLTHYVGDIHQPLHVGAVFLDAEGKRINPDEGHYDHASNTVGGNALQYPCGNLHSLWDDLPPAMKRGRMNDTLAQKARTLPKASAALEYWPELWANDSITAARHAYEGTQFSKRSAGQHGSNWSVALPLEYEKTLATMKEDAVARAGAHLAQILQTLWPE